MGKQHLTLPDFIILGANKAGTTSVARYLASNPDICISTIKEPMFFSAMPDKTSAKKDGATLENPFFSITLPDYSALFEKGNATVFGEASTSYLANPDPTAKWIRKIVPDVKLVAILRDPASRAASAYKMCYGNGLEKRSFTEIVDHAADELSIHKAHGVTEYIRNGLYSQLLRPYFDLFPTEQLLLIRYDDFKEHSQNVIDQITQFIGAQPFAYDVSTRYNTEADHTNKQLINDEDILRLNKLFQKDIVETQHLTGVNLSGWLQ